MKLSEWAVREDLTTTQMAERFGTTQATVSRLLNGKRRPGWVLLEKITAETNGAVQAADFFVDAIEISASPASESEGQPRGNTGTEG